MPRTPSHQVSCVGIKQPATTKGHEMSDEDFSDRPFTDDPSGGMAAMAEAPDEPVAYSRGIGDTLYCWQMQVESGWNIVGMVLQNGVTLPLVTTSLPLAWEAFEVAQAHANRHACQVRLACFQFETVAAIVEPND